MIFSETVLSRELRFFALHSVHKDPSFGQFIDFLPGVTYQEVLLQLAAICNCANLNAATAEKNIFGLDGLSVVSLEVQR